MKILVSGGKTGGHLIPGIAIYEELKKRSMELKYVMSSYDLQFPVTARVEEKDRIYLDIKSISRKLSLKTPLYILKIIHSFFSVFHTIRRFNPDAVIITGGYISNPVALSAVLLGKRLFIAEQNSVAGITNRFYAPLAKKIFTSMPGTLKVPHSKTVPTGNPSIFTEKINQNEAKKFFGVENFQTVIGITGGSQGAKKINDAVLNSLPFFQKNGIGVIWSAGSVDYNRLSASGKIEEIGRTYPNVKVFRFIEKMDFFLSSLNLVISRAGATSISEFIRFAVPGILIPIKNSPDNHQYLNARFIAGENAGLIIEEEHLEKEDFLPLLNDAVEKIPIFLRNIKKLSENYYSTSPEKKIADIVLNYHSRSG